MAGSSECRIPNSPKKAAASSSAFPKPLAQTCLVNPWEPSGNRPAFPPPCGPPPSCFRPPCCPPSCYPPTCGPLPCPPPCPPSFCPPSPSLRCPSPRFPCQPLTPDRPPSCCSPPRGSSVPPHCPPPYRPCRPHTPEIKPPPSTSKRPSLPSKRPGYFMMGCLFSMLKTGLIFGAGMYTGVYVAQNYQIDKVEDPKALFEKAQAFIKSKMDD